MDFHLKQGRKSRRKPVFSFQGTSLRTRVYIDGYNLYYGCLKGTSFKWLDVHALFENCVLPTSSPGVSSLEKLAIKYFTAEILAQAAKATDSVRCQEQYHSALRKCRPGRIEIIAGYYALKKGRARMIDPEDPKKWPRDCADVDVWKLEEKQSDVNLALHVLKDALLDEVDHVVVVTNDTDLETALEMVRALTKVTVGLVVPTTDYQRRPNKGLAKHAHWVRTHITSQELRSAQLPRVVTAGKKSAIKPVSWFAHSDVLHRALALAASERGTLSDAYNWLSRPNPHYDGKSALELIESGAGGDVISFLEDWKATRP